MTPTAVSLFAGVEGIGLALERAGFKVAAAVEIDAAARGVIADQMPDTALFDDVTKVTADELLAAGFDPRTGVICAGFPCQDLSVAGRRKGMAAGTRSGLFWHVVRLLAELRPRWVILENVPGLLSAVCPCPGDGRCGLLPCGRRGHEDLHPVDGGACGPGRCMVEHGGAMGAVLGSLGDLGYGFAYRVLDAQHFGVPQRRRRVVIVGCLGDDRRPVEILFEPEGSGGDPAPRQPSGSRVAATLTSGSHGPGVSAPGRRHEDDINLVANCLTAREGKGPDSDATTTLVVDTIGTLTASASGGWRIGADEAAAGQLIPVTYQKTTRPATSDHPDVWEERAVAATTLSPFDLGSESRAVELVVSATGERTHTLTAEGHDASEDGTGRGTPIITSPVGARPMGTAVRRLTPRECERLQGFPDDWTTTSWGKPQADSARYRQMGNAVAVPVFEWVAKRIALSDRTEVLADA